MYQEIIAVSPGDAKGLPTLGNIDFYFDMMSTAEYTRQEFDMLMQRLIALHLMFKESLVQKLQSEAGR